MAETSSNGITALEGLLGEFRKGRIVDKEQEKEGLKQHLSLLSQEWDKRFTDFPEYNYLNFV